MTVHLPMGGHCQSGLKVFLFELRFLRFSLCAYSVTLHVFGFHLMLWISGSVCYNSFTFAFCFHFHVYVLCVVSVLFVSFLVFSLVDISGSLLIRF